MLIVALDTSKKEPLYEQIYNSIKEEIITGVLPFGARLPSARRLSKHLDVSRNTVDTAYAQLCAEGYIESKPKRGFFVCQVEELAELHIPVKIEEEEEEIRPEKIPYDFSSAGVDMEQFPYHIWRKLLKEIMINDNSELFQKGNFQGDLELLQSDHVLSETIQRCSCSCQPDRSGSRNGESAIFTTSDFRRKSFHWN